MWIIYGILTKTYPVLIANAVIFCLALTQIILKLKYDRKKGYSHFAAGLCCGVSSLGAGLAIGIGGDAGVRALGQEDRIFVGMMLILIFAEALGLYGLIVSLILAQ